MLFFEISLWLAFQASLQRWVAVQYQHLNIQGPDNGELAQRSLGAFTPRRRDQARAAGTGYAEALGVDVDEIERDLAGYLR